MAGDSEEVTRTHQSQALGDRNDRPVRIFVNEYIYDSWFLNAFGRSIYFVTKSKFLSQIGRLVSTIIPSLRANTFGVGVRFRSNSEWRILFDQIGFRVLGDLRWREEPVSMGAGFFSYDQ